MDSGELTIRMIAPGDPVTAVLPETIRFSYSSDFFYQVEFRETAAGFSWELVRRAAPATIKKENKWRPFEAYVKKPRGYVATCEGKPVAYAEYSFQEWNKLVKVWHFYVKEEERGKGIGRVMMNEIEKAAKQFQARGIILETQTINAGAIEFYGKMGFAPWGVNTAEYGNSDIEKQEVLLWMGKKLQ